MSIFLDIRKIHIEISSKCVLKCPRCPRTELKPATINKQIDLDVFSRAFTPRLLKQIQILTFCGDIGDAIYNTDLLGIVKYIKEHSTTSIHIITNGSYKSAEWWTELGTVLTVNDKVTFSVDGWDNASNNIYRINSDWESIVGGATALRKSSDCYMKWSSIYFNFNENKMDRIRDIATNIGFNEFEMVKSSKFDFQYKVNDIDSLKPSDVNVASSAQYERQLEPLNTSKYSVIDIQPTQRHAWARCVNSKKEMFIGVDGIVLPCPWFNTGYHKNDFFEKYKNQININSRSLEDIVSDSLWSELLSMFDNNPLEICKLKCKNAKQ